MVIEVDFRSKKILKEKPAHRGNVMMKPEDFYSELIRTYMKYLNIEMSKDDYDAADLELIKLQGGFVKNLELELSEKSLNKQFLEINNI